MLIYMYIHCFRRSQDDSEPLEDLDGAFADARDCWKIDAETLKGSLPRVWIVRSGVLSCRVVS